MKNNSIIRLLMLFIIIFISITLCCCKSTTSDPFADPENPNSAIEADESTVAPIIEPVTIENCPDDTFYSMTTKEAYDKYGIISTKGNKYDWMFDGVYIYSLYLTNIENINSKTLGKYEYPNGGEWTAACTDPLCSHKAGSGCPFYNCNFNPVYYEGNLYFTTGSGSLCVYDKTTNKSSSLIRGCYNCLFYKYDGGLYFIYSVENDDFNNERVFTKILPDSKIVELGRLEDVYGSEPAVYLDRYAIDYKSELTDNGGKISVISRDLKTKEIKTIAEIECSGAVLLNEVQTYTIYGDKLLLETQFYTSVQNEFYENIKVEDWLIDLKTGEKRFICLSEYDYDWTNAPIVSCEFSSKCVMWNEKRQNESDPFTVHILFPYTGEEEVYDISEIVKKETGDTLPLDTFTSSTSNSAVVLRRIINNKVNNTYEIDLESRKVYKYDLK